MVRKGRSGRRPKSGKAACEVGVGSKRTSPVRTVAHIPPRLADAQNATPHRIGTQHACNTGEIHLLKAENAAGFAPCGSNGCTAS